MGKCKFSDTWLNEDKYKLWLEKDTADKRVAYCKLCRKKFTLGTMGYKALDSHMNAEKHKRAAASKPSPSLKQFMSLDPKRHKESMQSTPSSSVLSFARSGREAERAEVLWVVNSVTNHESYRANIGMGALFAEMFPDRAIAKSFRCSKDKTKCLTKF